MTVCYFTSKSENDVRVFYKECRSLSNNGFDVKLICPNTTNRHESNIEIFGVDFERSTQFSRLVVLPYKLYKAARKVDADIYHFNDPASLPYALLLKRLNRKVIFDSFEDHPTLILEKKLPKFLLKLVSKIYSIVEYRIVRKLDGIIACYHWTLDRYLDTGIEKELIFNFPILSESETVIDYSKKSSTPLNICYTGLISPIWNIEIILNALRALENETKLTLAGNTNEIYLEKLKSNKTWNSVIFKGRLSRQQLFSEVFIPSSIGLALLDYIPLCKGTKGNLSNNKLFEYMMWGIPVICTNFELWSEVIEKNNCGICVNPRKKEEIIEAIRFFINNPDKIKEMGNNGRKAVQREYNWTVLEKKLISFYAKISNK